MLIYVQIVSTCVTHFIYRMNDMCNIFEELIQFKKVIEIIDIIIKKIKIVQKNKND